MAYLDKNDEGWWPWALEFLRRGLHPDVIEIHGPHPYPSDIMWGKAEGCRQMTGGYCDVEFQSRRPCRNIFHIHGVTIWEDDPYGKNTFTILKTKELTPRWKKLLSIVRKKRDEDRKTWRQARILERKHMKVSARREVE